MPEQITILVSCVNGPLVPRGLALLREHTDLRYRIIGIDAQADAVGAGACDEFIAAPMGDADGYADFVLDLCRREGIQVAIPWSDEEALAIARRRTDFEAAGVAVAVPPVEVAEIASSKCETLGWLGQQGIPVPQFRRVRDLGELERAADELGFPDAPLTIKPAVARGGRGVWALTADGPSLGDLLQGTALDAITMDTFVRAAERSGDIPEMILMPFFPGKVYDVDILQNGDTVHYLVPRVRIHVRTNPFRGCIVKRDDAITALAEQVQAVLGMRCLYDLDIIRDGDGKPHMLEINPRMSASVVATMEAGLPLMDYLVRMLLGREVPRTEIPYGRRVRPLTGLHGDAVA